MLSADGCVDVLDVDNPDCCPPPLCGNDLCCTFVAFFNLLPSGPLWDYWKAQAISYFQRSDDPSQCPLITDPKCPSLILHAIYVVLKLRSFVHGPLWVAYRESNPYTAVITLDDHLQRLQWEDCYNQHCRSVLLGELTPLEVMGECGPVFCPPPLPQELVDAVKRGVAIALTRANMGIIKNQCSINWIIDPLGVEIVSTYPTPCVDPPDPPYPDQTPPPPPYQDLPCYDAAIEGDRYCEDCDPEVCNEATFLLRPTRDWLEGVGTGDVCSTLLPRPHVQAYFDWGICDRPAGLPDRIWPAMLSAECIVRSMLPPSCNNVIVRSC